MNLTAWLISIPLLSSPLIYLVGRLTVRQNRMRVSDDVQRVPDYFCWWISLMITALIWGLLVRAAVELRSGTLLLFSVGMLTLEIDGLSLLLATLALVVHTLVLLYSGADVPKHPGGEKYYAMLLGTTGAMIGMGCARDVFNLWVWFEAMVISSFLLVSFYRQRVASLSASVKYLMQSAVGSVLIVLGIALVFAHTGSLSLNQFHSESLPLVLLAAGALFITGFGIKSAFVPLHTWLPDVYAESPSRITALLSGAVTISTVIVLARALLPLSSAAPVWGVLLMGFGIVNTVVGNLLALAQTDLRRMLAYSSISHIGTIVIALGIGFYAGLTEALQAGLYYVLVLGVMETLAFLAVGALLFSTGGREDLRPGLTLKDLHGFVYRFPLPGFALALALLSLGGMPPFAGFVAKWQVFAAGVASPDPLIRGAVIIAALNILLSMAYYLPPLMVLFDATAVPTSFVRRDLPALMNMPLMILSALILLIGLWPDSLRWLTSIAASALMSGMTP